MLKIVIVEPETFTLLGIKGAIEKSPDIEVTASATSGKLGFQLIEQMNPDVVLVDLLLPDMSGLELTRSIKRKTNSKVVICTNQTHSDFINSAFRHGADYYMLKSADIELIELAIKRAYFNECLLDPKLAKKLL
ncbi:response regulator [Nostoc flagelliforme]|uniref:response regulator n=1 Tax=Nostoc flagelliforme TaxID=1306274 RepID=UPI001F556A5D|nr:response regulator transcription factor [Nostoc flagelliforme]